MIGVMIVFVMIGVMIGVMIVFEMIVFEMIVFVMIGETVSRAGARVVRRLPERLTGVIACDGRSRRKERTSERHQKPVRSGWRR